MTGRRGRKADRTASALYQRPVWYDGWLPDLIDQEWLKDILLGRATFSPGFEGDAVGDARKLYLKMIEAVTDCIFVTEDIMLKPDYVAVPCTEGTLWTVRVFLYAGDVNLGAVDDLEVQGTVMRIYSGYMVLTVGVKERKNGSR